MNRKKIIRDTYRNFSKKQRKFKSTKRKPTKQPKRTTRKARTRKQSNRSCSTRSKLTRKTNSTQHPPQTASRPTRLTSSSKWRPGPARKRKRTTASHPSKMSSLKCLKCTTISLRSRKISIHSSTRCFCTEVHRLARNQLLIKLLNVSKTSPYWMSANSQNCCSSKSLVLRAVMTIQYTWN